jgi:predicted kinase
MAGFPGSGKTTLARAIGRQTGAAVIDKDVIMAAAMACGVPGEDAGGLAYHVARELARSKLANGLSVILDTPAQFAVIRHNGALVASETGAVYRIIECEVTGDVAKERLLSRHPTHGLHPLSLDGVDTGYVRSGTAVLSEPHLQLDTTRALDDCLREALEYIGR